MNRPRPFLFAIFYFHNHNYESQKENQRVCNNNRDISDQKPIDKPEENSCCENRKCQQGNILYPFSFVNFYNLRQE